jgi:hypothetical protein
VPEAENPLQLQAELPDQVDARHEARLLVSEAHAIAEGAIAIGIPGHREHATGVGASQRSTRRSFVRLCYYVVVRTTLDISDEAYYIAKAIARDQNRSLGRVVGDLILQSSKGAKAHP